MNTGCGAHGPCPHLSAHAAFPCLPKSCLIPVLYPLPSQPYSLVSQPLHSTPFCHISRYFSSTFMKGGLPARLNLGVGSVKAEPTSYPSTSTCNHHDVVCSVHSLQSILTYPPIMYTHCPFGRAQGLDWQFTVKHPFQGGMGCSLAYLGSKVARLAYCRMGYSQRPMLSSVIIEAPIALPYSMPRCYS